MSLREQMTDVIEVAIDNAHDIDVTHRDYASAAADAIIEALPGMVPPLVWNRGCANTASGQYVVKQMDNETEDQEVWFVYRNGKLWGVLSVYYDQETAKKAVEDNNVATIMYALGL